jgi:hypothetical protein
MVNKNFLVSSNLITIIKFAICVLFSLAFFATSLAEAKGTERSGGGSEEREQFFGILGRALDLLISGEFQQEKLSPDQIRIVKLMKYKLRESEVHFTREQLKDRNGENVDFLNSPAQNKIELNLNAWERQGLYGKIRFGLHELLGLIEEADVNYQISRDWANRVTPFLNLDFSLNELLVETISIDYKNAVDLIRTLKFERGLNEVTISNNCSDLKGASENFKGFCIIRKRLFHIQGLSNAPEVIFLNEYFVPDK